ncbi:MAG: SipW-dependent-type signal peptide-containing protein [Aristaeellaceae bacterium]
MLWRVKEITMENNIRNHSDKGSRKRRLVLLAMALCIAAVTATGTLAYFTAEETAYNVITTGVLDMILHETTTGGVPFPADGLDNIMPGMVVDKRVTVENAGGVAFYLRVAVDETITPAEGVTEELSFEYITLDINQDDWTLGTDGYYYYNTALEPGDTTEPLFNTVTFAPEMGNAYMGARMEITVRAEAVQSRNNGDSPELAVGWASAD